MGSTQAVSVVLKFRRDKYLLVFVLTCSHMSSHIVGYGIAVMLENMLCSGDNLLISVSQPFFAATLNWLPTGPPDPQAYGKI